MPRIVRSLLCWARSTVLLTMTLSVLSEGTVQLLLRALPGGACG